MRRSTSILAALALLPGLTLIACGDSGEDIPPEADAMEAEVEIEEGVEVPAFSEEVRTAFRPPEGSDARVAGTLRLLVPTQAVDPREPPRLHVEVGGLTPGEHAWHIYEGPCGVEGGGLLIPLSDVSGRDGLLAPLQVAEDGTAEAEFAVPDFQDLWVEAGNYSVKIFSGSGTDYGELVACANL